MLDNNSEKVGVQSGTAEDREVHTVTVCLTNIVEMIHFLLI